ncbi:MAG: Short chain dehydrogenase [Hyphomicrobiales bacterium]|nr:Short chain dehydrogenase [Hyphomicrobiales bacterium]
MSSLFPQNSIAVITGAASGIGRAAARNFARDGMKIVMVDSNEQKLLAARDEIAGIAGAANVSAEIVDVASAEAMSSLAAKVQAAWGSPSLLMNNAAAFVSGGKGGILDPLTNWQMLFDVNVFGPINGVMAFLPGMLEAGTPAKIVNTGSKQGLTNPPGNPAYNTTKAALNAYTQNLAHDLRNRPGANVSAHLLVPGWTTTGDSEPKQGAWMPEQVIAFMVEALGRDEFFIICPDGETSSEMDRKRILWNALDIVKNRPALSRWHPKHKDAFAEFMKQDLPL